MHHPQHHGFKKVYDRLAATYDLVYGRSLQRGRRLGVEHMGVRHHHRVLEIGIGTGLSLTLYPREIDLVGIDISESMLAHTHRRVAELGMPNVRLHAMSGEHLEFPDGTFDRIFAPSVLSAMHAPERAMKEMLRVCKPDGMICVVAHFAGERWGLRTQDRLLDPLTRRFLGYRMTMPRNLVEGDPALRVVSRTEVLPMNFSTVYTFRRAPAVAAAAHAEPLRRSA